MSNENHTLTPAKIELISNVSGAYSAPFWDGLREVTGTYPEAIKRFIIEFLLDTHDLMIDYENEE